MHAIRRFAKRNPRYTQALRTLSWITLGLLLVAATFAIRLPSRVWLPDATHFSDDRSFMFGVPVQKQQVFTKYGRGLMYSSAQTLVLHRDEPLGPWTIIVALPASPLLKASACPNIADITPYYPSACTQKGTLQGAPVYTISRRMPSTTDESFVTIGNTFLYIKAAGGSSGQKYFDSFTEVTPGSDRLYLLPNARRVEQINSQSRIDKVTLSQKNAQAYSKLDFTPAIPQSLPPGWTINERLGPPPHMEIDGLNADHPSLINFSYQKNHEQSVTMHVGRLSDYQLMGPNCGPSPGNSMGYVACRKIGPYYQAEFYNRLNDYVRYLYYPVGDSLVISHIHVMSKDRQPPARPTELIASQDAITLSAKPVDKNTLKGAGFDKTFY
ncbi:MAG TPA: hypothetical protein VK694_01065 [Verrucomicrobiae bacterium]|nr:hypothetical protein [Verrucomicrobiae bacterium]